ncbi:hypothetical protein [Erythrobacter alti]|uniref:hypothetical protein n=1 Tax=Erythrobacter alti TaxID=1896145 RepID=UPI0030F3D404
MRFAALLLLMPVACAPSNDGADGTAIECALAGAAAFSADCKMESAELETQRLLIVHHPDGAFRRFELGMRGRGIVTADGMEQAEVTRSEGMVELQVGADRYRLPVAE